MKETTAKAKQPTLKQFSARIDAGLYAVVKLYCTYSDIAISAFVADALADKLKTADISNDDFRKLINARIPTAAHG